MAARTGGVDRIDPLDDMEETVEVTEVEVTRTNIEQTRSDIAGTLDAIKDKLQPQLLMEQAKENVSEAAANMAQRAKETVADVVQQAKEALPEMTANATHRAVDSAKEAVSHAVDSTKEAVGNAVESVREATSPVTDTIRHNPVPIALIGIGLGWLIASMRRQNSDTYASIRRADDRDTFPYAHDYGRSHGETHRPYARDEGIERYQRDYHTGYAERGVSDLRGHDGDRAGVGDTVRAAKHKVGEVTGAAKEKAEQVVDRVQEKTSDVAHRVQEKAGEVAHRVQEKASDLGERATYQARRTADWFEWTFEENPLVVGALAAGVGAAVGFMLPQTRQEHRWMGEARDHLVENVQETAQETMHKVRDVAQETVQEVMPKVRNVAQEAMDTVKEEARNQGLVDTKATDATRPAGANTPGPDIRTGNLSGPTNTARPGFTSPAPQDTTSALEDESLDDTGVTTGTTPGSRR